MPKYLVEACYVGDGVKGLLKEGGSKRREAVEQLARSMGGTVEAFYYAFGDTDLYVIFDMPNNVNMTAASLVAGSSGVVTVKTTVLITPEEVDQASKMTVEYRPPGK